MTVGSTCQCAQRVQRDLIERCVRMLKSEDQAIVSFRGSKRKKHAKNIMHPSLIGTSRSASVKCQVQEFFDYTFRNLSRFIVAVAINVIGIATVAVVLRYGFFSFIDSHEMIPLNNNCMVCSTYYTQEIRAFSFTHSQHMPAIFIKMSLVLTAKAQNCIVLNDENVTTLYNVLSAQFNA